MGYRPEDVSYIGLAERLGVGSGDVSQARIILLNEDKSTGKFSMTGRVKRLAGYVEPREACSACYGSLIYALDRLNDKGALKKGLKPLAIGQGYQGKEGAVEMCIRDRNLVTIMALPFLSQAMF